MPAGTAGRPNRNLSGRSLMMNKTLKTLGFASVLALSLALAGCGGGDSTIKAETTTTGQQLMDLKKAYEAGAISEKEYERERKKILDK
jgi:hypothetical protein